MLAPVERLFNNHQYCDEKWCYVLKAQKEGKPYCPEDSRPLYEKNVDLKMYEQLQMAAQQFQQREIYLSVYTSMTLNRTRDSTWQCQGMCPSSNTTAHPCHYIQE